MIFDIESKHRGNPLSYMEKFKLQWYPPNLFFAVLSLPKYMTKEAMSDQNRLNKFLLLSYSLYGYFEALSISLIFYSNKFKGPKNKIWEESIRNLFLGSLLYVARKMRNTNYQCFIFIRRFRRKGEIPYANRKETALYHTWVKKEKSFVLTSLRTVMKKKVFIYFLTYYRQIKSFESIILNQNLFSNLIFKLKKFLK